MIRLFASGLLAALALLSGSSPSRAQNGQLGFDCSRASTSVEKLICADQSLAQADATMAQLFGLAKISAFGRGASNQLASQRDWLRSRADCMTADDPRECVATRYHERNSELAVAILTNQPSVALPVLRQTAPAAAPLYEALQLYLTKPASGNWADPAYRGTGEKVAKLLAPFFAGLGKDESQSYGLGVLQDVASSPADAISSDAKMAAAFGIIAVYLPDDRTAGAVTFPCAAIISRPEMVKVAEPYFGSTLDNFLPSPDCGQTLPAQPRLEALVKALDGYWVDDCGGGSIRFAYYRSFDQLVTSARIGLPVGAEKSKLARKGLKPQLTNAAVTELADQYQRYNGLSAAEANKRARYWLGAMITSAGECES